MSDNRTSLEASATSSGSGAAISTTTASRTGSSSTANTTATTAKEAGEGSFADDRRAGRRRSDRIILASTATQQAVDRASTVARSNSTLLILGPGGSGRQHFARAIHAWSQRASGPLVHVSAGGTPESLQLREIFGATPDADPLGEEAPDGAEGALARAADGSLVIERADLLAPPVRQKLVQALRDGSYKREGADSIPLRVRVIATAEIGAEQALGDLAVQTLPLPALSERKEDILPLAAHFLAEFADDEGLTAVGFTVDARRWLIEEPWLGNVRELRERIRQAVRLSGSGSVSAEALMLSTEGDEVPSFKEAKRAFETRYVEGLLRRCSGNISRAARLAKKDRKDFYDVISSGPRRPRSAFLPSQASQGKHRDEPGGIGVAGASWRFGARRSSEEQMAKE